MSNRNGKDHKNQDGLAWFKDLKAKKRAETVAAVEKAMHKDPKDRSGEDFLAAHRLSVADRKRQFKEKLRLAQKSK